MMIALTQRNLKLFFRDKTSVFFSFLSAVIILGLYILFLGDVQGQNLGLEDGRYFTDLWMISGILAVTGMTSALGGLGIMVEDKTSGVEKDFLISPLINMKRILSHLFSAIFVSLLMSLMTLILAEGYLLINGKDILTGMQLFQMLGILVLSTISSASMVFFVVAFIQSNNAFTTLSIIVGTISGFLTGIYVPIGSLPSAVQMVIKLFPPSHSALLFKQVMMGEVLSSVPIEIVKPIELQLGIVYEVGDITLTHLHSILYLVFTALLFLALSYFTSKINRK